MIDIRATAEKVLDIMGRAHSRVSVLKMDRSTESRPGYAFLVFADDEKAPAAVIKATPDGHQALRIRQEFDNLTQIQACQCGRLKATVPEPLLYEERSGVTLLAETAKPGRLMRNFPPDAYFSSARFSGHFDAVIEWLHAYHCAMTPAENGAESSNIDRMLTGALARFRGDHAVSARLDVLLNDSLDALASQKIPLSPRHGDFCTANIMVSGGSSIAVIDWEYPSEPGWPLTDLLHFIASIWSIPFKKGVRGLRDNYHRLFFAEHLHRHRIRYAVSRYLRRLGVKEDIALFLSAMSWVFYANRKRAEISAIAQTSGVVVENAIHCPVIMIDRNRCLNLEMLAEERDRYIFSDL